jgi:N-acetylglutamate synthase-like GNAT family acetyltransferase
MIRPLTFEDLPSLTALASELAYPASIAELQERFIRLQQNQHHIVYVYQHKLEILGFIHLEMVLDLIEKEKIEIKTLVVREKARGNKIGDKLLNAAIAWARTKQLSTLYLNCNILRTRAHKFYEQQGFQLQRTSHFFEKNI